MELTQIPDPSGLTFNSTVEERDFYKDNYERLVADRTRLGKEFAGLANVLEEVRDERDELREMVDRYFLAIVEAQKEKGELLAEVERLKEELYLAQGRIATFRPTIEACEDYKAEVERLRQALRDYGEHDAGCPRRYVQQAHSAGAKTEGAGTCDWGLDDELRPRSVAEQAESLRSSLFLAQRERDEARAEVRRLREAEIRRAGRVPDDSSEI